VGLHMEQTTEEHQHCDEGSEAEDEPSQEEPEAEDEASTDCELHGPFLPYQVTYLVT